MDGTLSLMSGEMAGGRRSRRWIVTGTASGLRLCGCGAGSGGTVRTYVRTYGQCEFGALPMPLEAAFLTKSDVCPVPKRTR